MLSRDLLGIFMAIMIRDLVLSANKCYDQCRVGVNCKELELIYNKKVFGALWAIGSFYMYETHLFLVHLFRSFKPGQLVH